MNFKYILYEHDEWDLYNNDIKELFEEGISNYKSLCL